MKAPVRALLSAGLAAIAACGDAVPGGIDGIRPFELRLSAGQTWAPCTIRADSARLIDSPRCGEMPLSHPALIALSTTSAALAADTTAIHPAARQDLAMQPNEWQGYTRIINRLRQATALGEEGAEATLSTAHVARAAAVDDPTDLLRALEVALRAQNDVPMDTVLAFNIAVLLERLHLIHEARGAWDAYLAIDGTSEWAGEARTRLGRLGATADSSASNAASDPQVAREHAIDELLPEYARLFLAGDPSAAISKLDSARSVGEALIRMNGDQSVSDAVAAVDRARVEGREEQIVAGLSAWGEGRLRYEAADYEIAAEPLADAVRLLRNEPIALRGWAHLYLGGVEIVARRLQQAAGIYDAVRAETPIDRNPSLWARSAWGSGLTSLLQQDLPRAILHYDSAAIIFDRIGERENIGGVHFLLMETYAGLGQSRQSLDHALRALGGLVDMPGSQLRHNTLASLGPTLQAAGYSHAATAVLSEGVDAAERSGQPKNRVEALSRLAIAEIDVGRLEMAAMHVERALDESGRVSDRFMTMWSEAELARAHARILRDNDGDEAYRAQTTAVDYYRSTNNPVLFFPALAERASIALDAGDVEIARTDLEEAVGDLGRRTYEARGDPATVATLLESAAPVFDGLIAIHARSGNLDEAFGYAETARAVELAATAQTDVAATRNMLAGDGSQRLALTRASLGPGQMLLHSAVLLDRLHLWYVTRDSTMVRTVEIAEADLTDAINRFGVLLESRALAAADTIGTRLYETLLGPVLDDAAVDELIIVPDKALQRVAFAALRDPASGRYLIELMALVVAPSAAFALNASGPVRTARYERAVLVADPEFDRERFPDLPRLRNARQEVQALEDLYDGEITLDGVEATIAAFRAVASEADLIHFAGHGRYRPDRPDLSYLVFAKGGAEGGALLARDIRRLDLSQRPLVVLSACETALPELSRTGGFGALARSFLVAGAPAVVGSLWVVEDERTARFMASFHAQLANGQPPAAALRQAQIAAIREDDDRVGVWAAFRYEGVARQR